MPRPGGLSNILRQLAGPKPPRNRMNRQPQRVNREPAPIQSQPNFDDREPLIGFGPGPGPEQGFYGYSIFGGSEPFMEADNVGLNEGDNVPFDGDRPNGYSIF